MNTEPLVFLSHTDCDAQEFTTRAELFIRGAAQIAKPAKLVVVQVQDWFDDKWLNFGGKSNNAAKDSGEGFVIPPFHSNRVLSERHFVRDPIRDSYALKTEGKSLHVTISSGGETTQQRRRVAAGAFYVWYSSGSSAVKRGAIMAYVPSGETYWTWYLALEAGTPWHIVRKKGISDAEVRRLEVAAVDPPVA